MDRKRWVLDDLRGNRKATNRRGTDLAAVLNMSAARTKENVSAQKWMDSTKEKVEESARSGLDWLIDHHFLESILITWVLGKR